MIGTIPDLKQKTIGNLNPSPASHDVYGLKDCPWSKSALKLIDTHHIKYNYYLITTDE